MKSSIFKGRLQKKINQSHKNFDNEYFTKSLTEELETLESDAYGQFKRNLLIFQIFTPLFRLTREDSINIFFD